MWPEDKGWGISLESTAEAMLMDAMLQRGHVDEKRNPRTETLKELREPAACPDDTLENCFQISEQ